jgi:hypothetical protein
MVKLRLSTNILFSKISISNSLTKLLDALITHQKPSSIGFQARFGLILAQNITMATASGK